MYQFHLGHRLAYSWYQMHQNLDNQTVTMHRDRYDRQCNRLSFQYHQRMMQQEFPAMMM